MSTVNKYFVFEIISPFVGGADDDDECARFERLDMNDATIARHIVEQDIGRHFVALPPAIQVRAKASLAYYLATDRLDFHRIMAAHLFAFEVADARGLFVLIWETLFPGEGFDVERDDIIERNDQNEVFRLYTQWREGRTRETS